MAHLPQKTQAPGSIAWVVGDHGDLDQRLVQNYQTRHKMVLVLLLAFIVGAGSIQSVPHADPVATQTAVTQDLACGRPTPPGVLNPTAAADPSVTRALAPCEAMRHTTSSRHATEQPTPCLPVTKTLDAPPSVTLAAIPHAP